MDFNRFFSATQQTNIFLMSLRKQEHNNKSKLLQIQNQLKAKLLLKKTANAKQCLLCN